MIYGPKYGWCQVEIDEFESRASYLTDVPLDIADAFIELYTTDTPKVAIEFDAEGYTYDLILSKHRGNSYVVDFSEEKPKIYEMDKYLDALLNEFLDDIERDGINEWANFLVCGDVDELTHNKELLKAKIDQLKKIKKEHYTLEEFKARYEQVFKGEEK